MSRVRMLIAVSLVSLPAVAVAVAVADGGTVGQRASRIPFQAQGSFDASGNPMPSVDFFPDGAGSAIHWSMCAAPGTGTCQPIPATGGTADPGP